MALGLSMRHLYYRGTSRVLKCIDSNNVLSQARAKVILFQVLLVPFSIAFGRTYSSNSYYHQITLEMTAFMGPEYYKNCSVSPCHKLKPETNKQT